MSLLLSREAFADAIPEYIATARHLTEATVDKALAGPAPDTQVRLAYGRFNRHDDPETQIRFWDGRDAEPRDTPLKFCADVPLAEGYRLTVEHRIGQEACSLWMYKPTPEDLLHVAERGMDWMDHEGPRLNPQRQRSYAYKFVLDDEGREPLDIVYVSAVKPADLDTWFGRVLYSSVDVLDMRPDEYHNIFPSPSISDAASLTPEGIWTYQDRNIRQVLNMAQLALRG